MAKSLDISLQQKKDQVQKNFGKRLAEIRTNKNITQEKFAFDIGVDRTYVSYIERGKRNPSLWVLWRMSKLLNVKLPELMDF